MSVSSVVKVLDSLSESPASVVCKNADNYTLHRTGIPADVTPAGLEVRSRLRGPVKIGRQVVGQCVNVPFSPELKKNRNLHIGIVWESPYARDARAGHIKDVTVGGLLITLQGRADGT